MNLTPHLIVFIATVASIIIYRPISYRLGLVDTPSERKHHQGSIPLVGGLAMFVGISFGLFNSNIINLEENLIFFFIGALALVLVGIIDDYRGISSNKRFIFQTLVALIPTKWGGAILFDLGGIVSSGGLKLGIFSLFFSIFAIVGVINSLNFSDGIDGLSASLSLVTFISIAFFAYGVNNNYAFEFVLLFITAISAFLIFNVGLGVSSKFKIFMGDAGSTFLGFGVAWSLISFSQGVDSIFSPVLALWIFAVPLMDTIFVMINRILQKKSPFAPDRQHLHHFFISYGNSDRVSLLIIVVISILIAIAGVLMEANEISDGVMFSLFIVLSLIYFFTLKYAWKIIVIKTASKD